MARPRSQPDTTSAQDQGQPDVRQGSALTGPVAAVLGAAGANLAALSPAAAAAAGMAPTQPAQVVLDTAKKAVIVALILKLVRRFLLGQRKPVADRLRTDLAAAHPELTDAEVGDIVRGEADLERRFGENMLKRLEGDLAVALDEPGVEARRAAVEQALQNEQRYLEAHQGALHDRAFTKAEQLAVRKASPAGAYWRLGDVQQHTLGCLMMGERFWPWEVLKAISPPVHYGCACKLLSQSDAQAFGLMGPDDIPDTADAWRRARAAMKAEKLVEGVIDQADVVAYVALLEGEEFEQALAESGQPLGRGGRPMQVWNEQQHKRQARGSGHGGQFAAGSQNPEGTPGHRGPRGPLGGDQGPSGHPEGNVWQRTLREFPALRKYGIKFVQAQAQPGDPRGLEFYPPGESQSPDPKRPVVIVYGNRASPLDVLGDVVSHYLARGKDPVLTKDYQDFARSMTPQQKQNLREQYQWSQQHEGEKRSFKQWSDMTGVPAYFRGYAFRQWPNPKQWYTREQMHRFDQMMRYLRGADQKPLREGDAGPLGGEGGPVSLATARNGGDTRLVEGADISGAMIAFYPDAKTRRALARLDIADEPARQIHLTLVFLGPDAAKLEDRKQAIMGAVRRAARSGKAMKGVLGGLGMFAAPGETHRPLIGTADVPGLSEFRSELMKALGPDRPKETHGFVPHLTLAYLPRDMTESMYAEAVGSRAGDEALSRSGTGWGVSADDAESVAGPSASEARGAHGPHLARHLDALSRAGSAGTRAPSSLREAALHQDRAPGAEAREDAPAGAYGPGKVLDPRDAVREAGAEDGLGRVSGVRSRGVAALQEAQGAGALHGLLDKLAPIPLSFDTVWVVFAGEKVGFRLGSGLKVDAAKLQEGAAAAAVLQEGLYDEVKHPRDRAGKWRSLGAVEAANPHVTMHLHERDDGIKLDMIRVARDAHGQGHAAKALQDLHDYADQWGKRVYLTPGMPEGDQSKMSNTKLRAWYKRRGYRPHKGRLKDFRWMAELVRLPEPWAPSSHLSEAVLRYPKGTHEGGEFMPHRGAHPHPLERRKLRMLRKLLPHLPAAPAENQHGRWSSVGGHRVFVPERRRFERKVGGHTYTSPPGSTMLYRDGNPWEAHSGARSATLPMPLHPSARDEHAHRVMGRLEQRRVDQAQTVVGSQVQHALQVNRADVAPVHVGAPGWTTDDELRKAGFLETHAEDKVRHATFHYTAPDGASTLRVTYAKPSGEVHSHEWQPKAPLEASAPLSRAPKDFGEFGAMLDSFARRHAAENEHATGRRAHLTGVVTDTSMSDFGGEHEWSGRIRLGAGVARAVEDAHATRSKGGELNGDQAANVYRAFQTGTHEALHAANPISKDNYADPVTAALDEAHTEELSHVEAARLLRETGQHDVLRWLADNPSHPAALGGYLWSRRALDGLMNAARVAPEQREHWIRQHKLATLPGDRADRIAEEITKAGGHEPDAIRQLLGQVAHTAWGQDQSGLFDARHVPILAQHERSLRLHDEFKVAGHELRPGDRVRIRTRGKDEQGGWQNGNVGGAVVGLQEHGAGTWTATVHDDQGRVHHAVLPSEIQEVAPGGHATANWGALEQEVNVGGHVIREGQSVRWDGRADGGMTAGRVERILRAENPLVPGGHGWVVEARTADDHHVLLTHDRVGGRLEPDPNAAAVAAGGIEPITLERRAQLYRHFDMTGTTTTATHDQLVLERPQARSVRAFQDKLSDPLGTDTRLPPLQARVGEDGRLHLAGDHAAAAVAAHELGFDRVPVRVVGPTTGGALSRLDQEIADAEKLGGLHEHRAAGLRAARDVVAAGGGQPEIRAEAEKHGPLKGGTQEQESFQAGMRQAHGILGEPTGASSGRAMIHVDVQGDFLPGGALGVHEGDRVVEPLTRIGRSAYIDLNVATRDNHPEAHISFSPTGPWPPHAVQGTPGAEVHPAIRQLADMLVSKGESADREAYSAFSGTGLEKQLRGKGIDKVVVGGLATDYCVKATALDARKHGFTTTVVLDASRGVDVTPGDSARAVDEMKAAGVNVVQSQHDLEGLIATGAAKPGKGGWWPGGGDGGSQLSFEAKKEPTVDPKRLQGGEIVRDALGRTFEVELTGTNDKPTVTLSPKDGEVQVHPEDDLSKLKLVKGPSGGATGKPWTPPKPPEPVWDDAHTVRTVQAAGGSNGAQFAESADGQRWLVKTYRGNEDRVATEVLANGIYRTLGHSVPEAGTLQFGGKDALAYPLVDGETRQWKGADAKLGEGFMADALLANWDVVGLSQDNVLWNDAGEPTRIDQGGTMQFRAMGERKPFGPVPTEVWTMNRPGGQAFGTMDISSETKKKSAAEIERKLTPKVIDGLVDAAPFKDERMRDEVRDALKARVAWMGAYARGEVSEPKPAAGPDARAVLAAGQADVHLRPEQEAAVHAFSEGWSADVNDHLRTGAPKDAAAKEVKFLVRELDSLLGHVKTSDDTEVWVQTKPVQGDPAEHRGKVLRDKGFMSGTTETPAAGSDSTLVRMMVPRGSSVLFLPGLGGQGPAHPEVVFRRGARWKVVGTETLPDGRSVLEAILL